MESNRIVIRERRIVDGWRNGINRSEPRHEAAAILLHFFSLFQRRSTIVVCVLFANGSYIINKSIISPRTPNNCVCVCVCGRLAASMFRRPASYQARREPRFRLAER